MQKRFLLYFFFLAFFAMQPVAQGQIITTIAGTPVAGLSGDGGPAGVARLFYPTSVTFDIYGNLFISDAANRRIRKITPGGVISTVAGAGCGFGCYGFGGDGGLATASTALLYYPNSVAVDSGGNLYIADFGNYRIRKVSSSGILSTIAGNGLTSGFSPDGGPATAVNINFANVALDGAGNIYFGTGYRIRKVSPAGIITAYAGAGTVGFSGDGGPALSAQLNGNGNVAADLAGNLYIADNSNYRVRKVNTAGIMSTVAGNGLPGNSGDGGPATNASLNPFYVSVDNIGNLYITDQVSSCIRKVDAFGTITTIAGSGVQGFAGDGGPATLARLYQPGGVAVDAAGRVFIADGTNNRIRRVSYGNHAPHFTGGHSQTMSVCQYSAFDSVNVLLAVLDSDDAQAETWSLITPPAHGTVAGSYMVISNGGVVTPTGLYYTPSTGYTGTDSFRMKISDGLETDTMTIYVNVNAAPGLISGLNATCVGVPTTYTDTISGGRWSTSDAGIAGIGSVSGIVTGVAAGVVNLTYSPSVGCINTKTVTITPTPSAISGPAGVCAGGTMTVTNTVPGGVWTSTNTSIATINASTGVVNGLVSGADSIIYTMSPGCSVGMLTSVYPLPAAITGASHVCMGQSVTLADASPGGVWFSSAPANATVGLGSGLVTGITAGTVIITYSVSMGVTCSVMKGVTVDPLPATISGPGQVCSGSNIVLTDTGGGTWTSSAPATAYVGLTTGNVSGLAAGVATIVYALPTGCSTATTITVNPLPAAITGTNVICAGASTLLTGGTGGSWSSSNTSNAVILPSGTLLGIAAGTATISYSLYTGCATVFPVTVSPLPAPIGGPSNVCLGSTVTLTETTTGGTWSSFTPTTASVVPATGVVTGLAAGATYITYTTAAGCKTTTPMTVSELPALYAVTGGGGYCAGGTGTNIGLSGSSAAASYQLFFNGAFDTLLHGTGSALDFGIRTATGTYTVVAIAGSSGCSRNMSGSAVVIINPLPGAISGPSAVCVGSVIAETDGGGGTWSVAAPTVATIGSASGLVNGVTIGATTLTYTLPTGCFTTKAITVSTTPSVISGASVICAGTSTLYTDSVSGGTWSSSLPSVASVGSAGNVSGGLSGTAVITYSLGSGCITTKSITVNAQPAAISGGLGVCTGHSITLTDASPGGSWGSGLPAVATAVPTTGVINGITAGVAPITYTGTNGCYVTAMVTVNSAPGAIGGGLHGCVGQTTPLTNPSGGGIWNITSTTIATVVSTTGVMTGVGVGNATVVYSLGSGGCSVSAVVTVTATPAAIAGTASVCVGSGVTLTDATAGGVWTSTNSLVAGVSGTGVVTGVANGVTNIDYTVGGCSVALPVTVNPLPAGITGAGTVCVGLTAALSDADGGGVWSTSLPGVAVIGPASGIVTGVAGGPTLITYTLPTGCQTTRGMTINPAPAAISGSHTLCLGSTIPLTDGTVGGTWSAAGGIVSVSPFGVVTGLALGASAVSYSVAGCPTVFTVTVNNLPAPISGPNHVCSGSTVTLTDGGGGSWSSATPGIASVGSATGVVLGGAAGVTNITYSAGPGCAVAMTMTVNGLPSAIAGPGSMCTGGAVTLSDFTPGGVWSSTNPAIDSVGPTGIVTGLTAGVATISYTIANGCAATRLIASIVVPPISFVHNLCAWGDTMTVSDSITTGIYTSSLVTVTNLGGGNARVTANSPGTASLTYILPTGCLVTNTFTVNPLPNTISGMSTICLGDSVTVTDASPGGVWSTGTSGVLSVGSASGRVHGLSLGSAAVTYTLLTTGCRVDTTISVIGLPNAGVITGTASLCGGTTVTLADSVAGGVWSSVLGLVSVTGGLVTGTTAGTDTVLYAVANMCGTSYARRDVTVHALPVAGEITGVDSVCVGNTLFLYDTASGGVWSSSNGNATIGSTGIVTGAAGGLDTILYTVSNAWCTAVAQREVTIIPIGLCGSLWMSTTADASAWKLWPNPSTGDVTLTTGMAGMVVVYTAQGQVILRTEVKAGANELRLPGVSAGMYYLDFSPQTGAKRLAKIVIAP